MCDRLFFYRIGNFVLYDKSPTGNDAQLRARNKSCILRNVISNGGSGMGKLTEDEKFMKAAMREAKKAWKLEEVPIGCVIVYEGKIIARGYNRRNTDKNTLSHAELNAIRKASKRLGDWRLEGCTIYITLEPCQMCSGAIVQARMTRAVIGSMNAKAGCAGSVLNILEMPEFNHQVNVTRGILQEECSQMLSDFFRELRRKKKAETEARKAAREACQCYCEQDTCEQ